MQYVEQRSLVVREVDDLDDTGCLFSITVLSLPPGKSNEVLGQLEKQLEAVGICDGYRVENKSYWVSRGADHSAQEVVIAIMGGVASGAAGVLMQSLTAWGMGKIRRRRSEYRAFIENDVEYMKNRVVGSFNIRGDLEVVEVSRKGEIAKGVFKDVDGSKYNVEVNDAGVIQIRKVVDRKQNKTS